MVCHVCDRMFRGMASLHNSAICLPHRTLNIKNHAPEFSALGIRYFEPQLETRCPRLAASTTNQKQVLPAATHSTPLRHPTRAAFTPLVLSKYCSQVAPSVWFGRDGKYTEGKTRLDPQHIQPARRKRLPRNRGIMSPSPSSLIWVNPGSNKDQCRSTIRQARSVIRRCKRSAWPT